MKKFTILACASLLAVAGNAFAEQSLTDAQMDGVSAGAVVLLQGTAGGLAQGVVVANLLSNTTSRTNALADPTGVLSATLGYALGQASNTSIATSVTDGITIGGAQARSSSEAAASIF
jgi:hypothetical protein